MHDMLKLVFWKKKKKKREQEEEGKTIALLLKVATIAAIATALKIASLAFFLFLQICLCTELKVATSFQTGQLIRPTTRLFSSLSLWAAVQKSTENSTERQAHRTWISKDQRRGRAKFRRIDTGLFLTYLLAHKDRPVMHENTHHCYDKCKSHSENLFNM